MWTRPFPYAPPMPQMQRKKNPQRAPQKQPGQPGLEEKMEPTPANGGEIVNG
jgi:hypothetical protein